MLAVLHVVVEFKRDLEVLLLKHPREVPLVDPLKKALFATLNLAPPTVSLLIGLLGLLVIRLVVEEANKEPVKLHSPQDSEEKFAHRHKRSKHATMPLALSIALWMCGEIGHPVINHVDQE